jgi:DNA-binding NarL/FixJ family response regulator
VKRARIILGDDHVLILEGFRKVLEPRHEVVHSAKDGRSLAEAAVRLKPDLIVLDITMPLLNGIDAARQIRKELPRVKLLFVTMHASPTYLREAFHAGASGYVLKSSAREEILGAVEKVLSGGTYISPELDGEGPDRLRQPGGRRREASLSLTPREREILQMIAEGRSGKEMAAVLKISAKTVEFHRDNIKSKLGLRTIAELTRHAIQEGLV